MRPPILADTMRSWRDPNLAPEKMELFGVGVSVAEPDGIADVVVRWAADRRPSTMEFMVFIGQG